MAYVYDVAQTTQQTSTGGTIVCNMPTHQANDILVIFVSTDSGTIATSATVSTWNLIGTNPTSSTTNIIVTASWWVKAASAAETISITTGDVAAITIVAFRDVDGTTPFDGVTPDFTAVNTATSTPVSVSITSTTNNALYVSFVASAGAVPQVLSGPGAMWVAMSDAGTGTTDTLSAHNSCAWTVKATAGATPVINWVSNLSMQYTRLSFVLRNTAGGKVPAYIDGSTLTPATLIHPGHHIGTLNGTSASTNGITATINGKTATPSTATLLTDSGLDPYVSIVTSAAAQTAATALVGPEITITTPVNATGKLIAGCAMAANWKQAKFGVGSVAQGGVVFRIGSGTAPTTAWNAYQVSAKNAQVPTSTPAIFVVEPEYATTAYATGAGGNCSASAVKFIQLLRNAPLFSSQVGLAECWLIDKQVIAGGVSTAPVDLDGMVDAGKSFRMPLIQKAGAASVVCFAPIQLGGGSPIYFSVNLGVIQFPQRASAAGRDLQYHASDNKLGLYLSGKSGDTITLSNSLVTSPVPQIFEITSAATSAATWNLNGTTLSGMTVTLRPVTTFTGMSFTGCIFTALNVSTLAGCLITGSGMITHDGSTIGTTTITKTTSATAAYTITLAAADAAAAATELNTALGKLTTSRFTNNTTGPALRIVYTGTAGAISANLSNVAFSGNTTDIRYEGTAGSNLTLSLTSGANPSTYTATNSNTVTFSQSNAFAVTNVVYGSEVRIFRNSDQVELAGVEEIGISAGSNGAITGPDANGRYTFTYTHANSSLAVYVVVLLASGSPNYQIYNQPYTLTNTTQSLLVSQIIDRNFSNI